MPFTQPWFEVDFGASYAAIATTGYRLYQNTGADSVARTTVGVVDLGNGAYGVPSVSVPDNAAGIEWDTGGGSPVYAREDIEPLRDLTFVAASTVGNADVSGDDLQVIIRDEGLTPIRTLSVSADGRIRRIV